MGVREIWILRKAWIVILSMDENQYGLDNYSLEILKTLAFCL